jgi:aryl carrier-like protein
MIISLSQETLAASSSTASVHSTGYISTLPIINLAINPQVIIGSNKLSLGFNLHHDSERSTWYSKSTLRQLGMDMNTKMIRMFTHELEPCTSWNDESKTGSFNWQSVDSLIGRIFDTGAQPLLTIGFADFNGIQIPPGMALNPSTGLPYPDSFAAYCQEWIKHFKQTGMPVKYYEIINEASYYFYPNWNWNQAKAQNYLTLYNTAYNAMHTENNQVQVGTDSSLYTQFLNFWKTNGGKLDFFSCHKYDSWGISYTDSQGLDSAERKFFGTYDSYHISISAARNLWGSNLQAIATEANFGASQSSGTDPRLQQLVGTVWTGIVLRGAILNGFDYLCYYSFSSSKTWELRNKASGGYGFGMINQDNNQPWYPYYVQSMVATNLAVGDPIVATTSSSSDVSSVAWIDAGKLNILVINKVNQQTTLSLTGLQGQLSVQKISNAISYQTPKIQTGTISASSTINLDGYAVVLIQTTTTSTPTPPPPPSPNPDTEPPSGG